MGTRQLDVDVEDYRGVSAAFAGQKWARDHPLPTYPRAPAARRLAEEWAMAMGMYEAGIAAALLFSGDPVRLEMFMKGYMQGLSWVDSSKE